MAKAPVALTSLSEEQRAEAYARFELLRPVLEEGVSQAQIVRTHQLSKSAVQRWVKRYREQGLAGLVTTERKDKGKSRILPDQAIILVEGLALQTPPRSAAAIHRQVVEIATKQGWKPPSYERYARSSKASIPPSSLLPTRDLLRIEKSLISSIDEKRPMPMPCGKPIIPPWM